MASFSSLKLSKPMLANLKDLKYFEMTEIQEKSIPAVIAGKDIIAQAKTGSGKTAAFGIGMLENLNVKRFRVQSLIICPTRELADQVTKELRRIARFQHNIKILSLTGGVPQYKQEHSLSHQAHIAVGTPGRLHRLIQRGSLNMEEVKTVVLDEADKMLEMGFIDQVADILRHAPDSRQTLCYSATFPTQVKEFTRSILNNPEEITVESHHDESVINQNFYEVTPSTKVKAVVALLSEYQPDSTIIFCNTKDACKRVRAELNKAGFHSIALHGDIDQKERTETLIRFANGSSRVMVATDVAARGIDIDELACVINFDLPFESETYVHRIGRTGRAGKEGLALSLMIDKEQFRLDEINQLIGKNLKPITDLDVEHHKEIPQPDYVTLSINGGRKQKVSAGDILGALTKSGGIPGSEIGKIDRLDYLTFVAISRNYAKQALKAMENNEIKGRKFKALIND